MTESCSLCSSPRVVLSVGAGRHEDYCGQVLPVPEDLEFFKCLDCRQIFFTTQQIIAFNTAMGQVLKDAEEVEGAFERDVPSGYLAGWLDVMKNSTPLVSLELSIDLDDFT